MARGNCSEFPNSCNINGFTRRLVGSFVFGQQKIKCTNICLTYHIIVKKGCLCILYDRLWIFGAGQCGRRMVGDWCEFLIDGASNFCLFSAYKMTDMPNFRTVTPKKCMFAFATRYTIVF